MNNVKILRNIRYFFKQLEIIPENRSNHVIKIGMYKRFKSLIEPLCALVKILWSTIQPTKFEVSNKRRNDGEDEGDGFGSSSNTNPKCCPLFQTSFLRALLSSYAEAFFFEDKTPVRTNFFFHFGVASGPKKSNNELRGAASLVPGVPVHPQFSEHCHIKMQ